MIDVVRKNGIKLNESRESDCCLVSIYGNSLNRKKYEKAKEHLHEVEALESDIEKV